MKPDKKKESITEEYQRPPLLEEIKKFKEELKLVSSFVLFSAGLAAIIAFWNKVASLLANISLFFGNVWSWIQNLIAIFSQYLEAHSSDILLGILLVILTAFSTYLLKESTVSRHYIYNRYRIGHYSKMMWTFIGGGLVQLITISLVVVTIWYGSFVVALFVYIISFASMLIFINRTNRKLLNNKPKLEKPLTRTQNNARKLLIDFLYFYLFSQQGDFLPFYKVCSRESDYQNVAEQIAKFAFIADTMPEELTKGVGYISGRLLDEVIDSESTILDVDINAYMLTRCIDYFDTICEPSQEDWLYAKYKEQALKMLLQLKKVEKNGFYSIDSSYDKYTKFFE